MTIPRQTFTPTVHQQTLSPVALGGGEGFSVAERTLRKTLRGKLLPRAGANTRPGRVCSMLIPLSVV